MSSNRKNRWQRFLTGFTGLPLCSFLSWGRFIMWWFITSFPWLTSRSSKIKWSYKTIYNGVLIGIIALLCWPWTGEDPVHGITLDSLRSSPCGSLCQHQHEHGYKRGRLTGDSFPLRLPEAAISKTASPDEWFTSNIAIHHVHHLNPAIPNCTIWPPA